MMTSKIPFTIVTILAAAFLTACGAEKSALQKNAVDLDSTQEPPAPNGGSNVRRFTESDLQKIKEIAQPAIVQSEGMSTMGAKKKKAVCPEGFTEDCLNSALVALGNSPVLKWTTIGLQGKLSVLKNGTSLMKWKATATQPGYGVGYTLASSTFSESSVQTHIPLSGALGSLALVSQAPAAAIGGFVVLTDGSSFAGIAGGFAGVSPQGYITGAFGCGFSTKSINGVPVAECFAIPLSAVGW